MAIENVFHNQRLYREYKRKSAMESIHNLENGENSRKFNVLQICNSKFFTAKAKEKWSNQSYVNTHEATNQECVTVHDVMERYSMLIFRPKYFEETRSDNIAFWIIRYNVHTSDIQKFEYLVALNNDTEQFYKQDKETDKAEPYGLDESRELSEVIKAGYMMPLKET